VFGRYRGIADFGAWPARQIYGFSPSLVNVKLTFAT
jgi:hypothetical protein